MQIVQWSLLLILVFIVPNILGTLVITNMERKNQTPAMNYLCGWFLCFAIFEVIAVPMILLQQRFTYVVVIYSLIVAFLSFFAFARRKSVYLQLVNNVRKDWGRIGKVTKLAWVAFGILVLAQVVASIMLDYYDGDDPYFLPIANMANLYDDMYVRDAYTGFTSVLDMRHALSPTPLYYAWLSRLTGVHVASVAHVVLAPAFFLLMYAAYAQICKRLFVKNINARPFFMLLLVFWYVYGNFSIYTIETFAMNRTWQGKAILGNIVLPTLMWCLLRFADQKRNKGVWILFILTIISSVFCSSISFMLIPTVIGMAFLILLIQKLWRKDA